MKARAFCFWRALKASMSAGSKRSRRCLRPRPMWIASSSPAPTNSRTVRSLIRSLWAVSRSVRRSVIVDSHAVSIKNIPITVKCPLLSTRRRFADQPGENLLVVIHDGLVDQPVVWAAPLEGEQDVVGGEDKDGAGPARTGDNHVRRGAALGCRGAIVSCICPYTPLLKRYSVTTRGIAGGGLSAFFKVLHAPVVTL